MILYADNYEIIQTLDNGFINWMNWNIYAKAISIPSEKYLGQTVGRTLAEQKAQKQAYENLFEIVRKVQIDSSLIINKILDTNKDALSSLEKMVQGAVVSKKEYLSDGTVEVTVKMNMFGGFTQLFLPDEFKYIEKIKPIIQETNISKNKTESSEEYTGLIVDARDINARPALSIKITDESGDEVYGSSLVSREIAVQNGMAVYYKNIDEAQKSPRIGKKPYNIKALLTKGELQSDLVISNTSAAFLTSSSNNLMFLKKCAVIIIIN